MLLTVKTVWKCIFTPRLVKLHENGPVEKLYEPTTLETLGDQVIQSLCLIWKLGVYTTPLIAVFLYRRGYFEADGAITLTKFVSLLSSIVAASYLVRAVGRANNPMYQRFIKVLNEAQTDLTPSIKQQLANYDFEFFAWPVEFRWADVDRDEIKDRIYLSRVSSRQNYLQLGMSLPCHILGYLAMHSFGIRLIYPGSMQLLQNFLAQNLLQGRSKLVEVNAGQRYKLLAKDENEIDVMFVDRRNGGNNGNNGNGNTLVVCSEGNAGFYEIGIMGTPIASGYSVLGWNHPGFGGSTGTPYPSQELNAMDVVMQFAIHRLGFRVENIVLFGWSIGGFSSSWAAMNYPEVRGVVLDASFDDIMPLALNQMPAWSESVVRLAIREYVNLNNFEQLCKYPGPVLLIRRTEDEVICTTMGNLASNRGNNLLMKLLKFRYPLIMGEIQQKILDEYLSLGVASAQDQFIAKYEVDESCKSIIDNHVTDLIRLGENLNDEEKTRLTLYLARKYMKDFKATHCSPLPSDMFQMPWDIIADNDFVFT